MEEDFYILYNKIINLNKNGPIRVDYSKYNNIGLLLEYLLGISPNSFSFADMNGIEIKVANKITSNYITLFSCVFDGEDFFEAKCFLDRYGAKDKIYPSAKVLYIDLGCINFSNWGSFIKMKLDIDYINEKLYVLVVNNYGKTIERRAYWNFKTLEKIIYRKLSFLCLVYYKLFYYNGIKYCKFSNPLMLKLISFNKFLLLLSNGSILININCGVYRSGIKKGKSCIHGFTFKIKREALYELFDFFTKKNST